MFIELFANGYEGKRALRLSCVCNERLSLIRNAIDRFNTYVEREMESNPALTSWVEAIVETYFGRPGASEHQDSLALTSTIFREQHGLAREDVYKWLVENCYKFGFILRYLGR